MYDPRPQTAAEKVHLAFVMSLDGFVAGPGHSMDFMEGTTVREGLHQEYIESTGAKTPAPPRASRFSAARWRRRFVSAW